MKKNTKKTKTKKSNNNKNKNKFLKKNETTNLTKLLYKIVIFNLQKVNIKSLRDRKSMVAFNIRVLLLLSKELSPYRRVSVICKSSLSKMCLLMFLIVFRKVDISLE